VDSRASLDTLVKRNISVTSGNRSLVIRFSSTSTISTELTWFFFHTSFAVLPTFVSIGIETQAINRKTDTKAQRSVTFLSASLINITDKGTISKYETCF
jgi:hypothetical protein